MLKSGIYKITNTKNSKVYIGQSVNLKERLAQHKSSLIHNNHSNTHLQRSFNKYGLKAFRFEIITRAEESELDDLERYYILFCNSFDSEYGYNQEMGGTTRTYKRASEELRKRLSEACKGRYAGEKNPNYGKHWNDEFKKIMRELMSNDIEPAIQDFINGMNVTNSARKNHVDASRLSAELKKRGLFRNYPNDLEPAIEAYSNGLCMSECIKQFKVSFTRLSPELKRRGLLRIRTRKYTPKKTRQELRKISNHSYELAIKDYIENGETIAVAARKYRINSATLSEKLKALGVWNGKRQAKYRERISNTLKAKPKSTEKVDKAVELWLSGVSVPKVEEQLHLGHSRLSNELKRRGLYVDGRTRRFKNENNKISA